MKLSEFEKDVLAALIEGDDEEGVLKAQLANAEVQERDYTGCGLYVHLTTSDSVPLLRASHRLIEKTLKLHLVHPSLDAGAGALLWFEEGQIRTLECYTYDGEWPQDESKFRIEKVEQSRPADAG